jgi:hypothetical protein
VPTTGEHAWRATWTPDPDAVEQFLRDLDPEDWGAVADESLIELGYEICADYYRGVIGEDMFAHLQEPSTGLPGPTELDRLHQTLDIEMAARGHFCLNIDPWGESY